MKYSIIFSFFLIAQLVFAESISQNKINNYSAIYEVYHNETHVAHSSRKLTSKNNVYELSSKTELAGIFSWFSDITVTETSRLLLKNNKLKFQSYSFQETDNDKNKSYELYLEKKTGKKKKNNQNSEPLQFFNSHLNKTLPAAENLQDTLGFTVAIMHDLQKGNRNIRYTIAEKDNLKTYSLKFLKNKELTANNKALNTIKLEHYNPETQHRFTFWCAEELNYLPVRIQNIKKNGDEILLNLIKLNNKKLILDIDDETDDE